MVPGWLRRRPLKCNPPVMYPKQWRTCDSSRSFTEVISDLVSLFRDQYSFLYHMLRSKWNIVYLLSVHSALSIIYHCMTSSILTQESVCTSQQSTKLYSVSLPRGGVVKDLVGLGGRGGHQMLHYRVFTPRLKKKIQNKDSYVLQIKNSYLKSESVGSFLGTCIVRE